MFKLEKLATKAILTIYGYVGGYFLDFRAVAAALEDITKSGFTKLDFHIHTYGGNVFDGNLICNFLQGFKGEVDIYIDGVAASMGSVIIMSGTRVHIAENGFVMIHAPQGDGYGTAKQLIQTAKMMMSMEKNFTSKLMSRTGKTEAEVRTWFDGTDYWFDADECIALKLADDKFSPGTITSHPLTKAEAMQSGAKAVYESFTAILTNTTNPKHNMNKKDMIARYKLTGVTEESTDEQIMAAIDAKLQASEDAASASATAAKATNTKVIEASVDAAIAGKKIKKDARASYIERGKKLGIDELNSVFADMNAYEPISRQINGKGAEAVTGEDRSKWGWNDYQTKASADLEAMPTADPEKFKALFKAEYGSEPGL